jgi:Shedu protein SduA, C-terminal
MPDIITKENEDGTTFLKINKKTKKGKYTILPHFSQHKLCEQIDLIGFDRLPSGFYTNDGIGLTTAGTYLLRELSDKYKGKKVALTLSKKGVSKVDGRGKVVKASIPHEALSDINADVRATKRVRNEEIRAEVRGFLSKQFKTQFKHYSNYSPQYAAGTLAETLKQKNVLSRLGVDDRAKLEEMIPDYLASIKGTLRAKKKLKIIFDTLDAGKKVYLEKVIKEFKTKLKRKVQNEQIWQDFLSDNILVLRNTYGEVLEKESVTLQGKYPDFMLLDPYSYLDIYEIKKPSTNLLKYDKSRNNYYWDVEMAKAIAQVENYLHQVQRSSDMLINDIRRNKGIDVSIVRPKGYIIAGTRNQLTSTKMLDDFRILSEALKNIDVLLYDDLLNNLEAFVDKIST